LRQARRFGILFQTAVVASEENKRVVAGGGIQADDLADDDQVIALYMAPMRPAVE
jgi:hypothetical protein